MAELFTSRKQEVKSNMENNVLVRLKCGVCVAEQWFDPLNWKACRVGDVEDVICEYCYEQVVRLVRKREKDRIGPSNGGRRSGPESDGWRMEWKKGVEGVRRVLFVGMGMTSGGENKSSITGEDDLTAMRCNHGS